MSSDRALLKRHSLTFLHRCSKAKKQGLTKSCLWSFHTHFVAWTLDSHSTHTHARALTHTHTRARTHTHTHTYTYTHTLTRTHAQTYTYTHTHTHTQMHTHERERAQHSLLQGRERCMFNQANMGTVPRATLWRLLRDGAERIWAYPSPTMPS